MSKYRRFAFTFLIAEIIIAVIANIYAVKKLGINAENYYKVDVNRICKQLETGKTIEQIDLDNYETVVALHPFIPEEEGRYRNQYVVKEIGGELICFEYSEQDNSSVFIIINGFAIIIILANIVLLVYLENKMIKPFSRMNELTAELAKGNLSVPIKQEKSKFFGRFLWGIDMLRETLEGDKKRELNLLKEKNTLILSLSHDIKTPLSAIDLYTKALRRDLYTTKEERTAAFDGIDKNVNEIKRYVKEITEASREDFLSLEVNCKDVYLSRIMKGLDAYYTEKMSRLHIDFEMEMGEDCLIYGDYDRLIEVLQNVIENAIKYGDGRWINLITDEEEDCKLVTVQNSGCTLKEEELPNIFDSFYRGSNSEKQEGSGLGLYICKQLMHRMDGEIFANCRDEIFSVTVVIKKS